MDVLVTGYPSLDHIARVSHSPAVGETAHLLDLPDRVTYGGCGINTGVALARLGFRVGAALVLGDDADGLAYVQHLAALGIDVHNVQVLAGQRSSHSYLFLNPDGQYQNFFFPGAADAWAGTLTLHGVERYRLALVTVGQAAYNAQFVERVCAAGVPLVWGLKPDVFAYPPALVRRFLGASAYVLMNHIEAEVVLQAADAAELGALLGANTRALVITQGAQGVRVITHDGATTVPAVPPARLVDPTGAGDAFAAGFIAGLLRGASPVVAAQLGAVLASFVLEEVGCQTNLPDWAGALARYREHFGVFEGEII